ncbi:hypothetical protein HJD18_00740 [Thermoleophilia bacterium SCSIO 60948]|nr:hypothetical protein HJD18_00740 [Thermoleophilia bacterium SCSIO 60948]
MEAGERSSRVRLVVALALFLGLGVAALLVALGGSGGDGEEVAAADPACVERWNDDPAALQIGRHQYGSHGYTSLEVVRLSEDGTAEAEGGEGVCTLVFPAQALDPEPPAAALAYLQGSWVPLSALPTVSEIRLAELQSDAFTATNATMDAEGRITAEDASDS